MDRRKVGEAHELRYPTDAFVLVIGVPGAGKTTLLRRLFKCGNVATLAGSVDSERAEGVRVLDSGETRTRLRPWLGWLPYAWWRPVVHAAHYVRVLAAIRAGGPLVVSDPGTRPIVRRLLVRQAHVSRVPLHLVLLDVTEEQARSGQAARGRRIGSRSFRRHYRRWRALLAAPRRYVRGAASVVVLDRRSADDLHAIRFGAPVPFD